MSIRRWSLWDTTPEDVAAGANVLDVVDGVMPAWVWQRVDEGLAARNLIAVRGTSGDSHRIVAHETIRHMRAIFAALADAARTDPVAAAALSDMAEEAGGLPVVDTSAIPPPAAVGNPAGLDVSRVRRAGRRRTSCDLDRLGTYQAQVLDAVFAAVVQAGAAIEVRLPISAVHARLPGGAPATNSGRAALSRALAALERRGLLTCHREGGRYTSHLSLTSAGWRAGQELCDARLRHGV